MNEYAKMFQLILDQTPEDRYQKYVIFCKSIKMTEAIQGLHYNAVCCNPLDGGLMIDQIEQMILDRNGLLDHKVICCGSRDFNQQMQTFLHDNNRSYIDNGWKMLSNKDYLADSGRDEDLDQAIRQFIDKYDPEPVINDLETHRLTASVLLRSLEKGVDPIKIKEFPILSEKLKIKPQISIIVSAETGAGKSSLALNLARALNKDYTVLYFDIEMTERIVNNRLLAIESGLPIDEIERYGNIELRNDIEDSAQRLAQGKPFYIYHDLTNLSEIEKTIKQVDRDPGEPMIVFVDHLHLVSNGIQDPYQRATELAKSFKQIAKKENLILFLLAQQNRAGKADQTKPPTLASLKDSGELENSADKVMFLWEKPKENNELYPELYLVIAKNREGQLADIRIDFDRQTQRITEADTEQFPDTWR